MAVSQAALVHLHVCVCVCVIAPTFCAWACSRLPRAKGQNTNDACVCVCNVHFLGQT